MTYFIGLVIMLIGARIAVIDVENTNLPDGTPVVFIGMMLVLIGYLFIASHNISEAFEDKLFLPLKLSQKI